MEKSFREKLLEYLQNGDELVSEGYYEVTIKRATPAVFSSQTKGIKLILTVRDDMDQNFKNHKLFDNPNELGMYKFEQLAESIGFSMEDGWETLDEFCELIVGQPVRVYVNHKSYKERLQEHVCRYMTTEFPLNVLAESEQIGLDIECLQMKLMELNQLGHWEIDDRNAHDISWNAGY